jgi:hypothetical protein
MARRRRVCIMLAMNAVIRTTRQPFARKSLYEKQHNMAAMRLQLSHERTRPMT